MFFSSKFAIPGSLFIPGLPIPELLRWLFYCTTNSVPKTIFKKAKQESTTTKKVHIYIYIHIHMRIYIYTYIHTLVDIYIYTYFLNFSEKKPQPTKTPKTKKKNTLRSSPTKKCRGLRPRLRSWALAFLFCPRCPCSAFWVKRFQRRRWWVSFVFVCSIWFVVVRVCVFSDFFDFLCLNHV